MAQSHSDSTATPHYNSIDIPNLASCLPNSVNASDVIPITSTRFAMPSVGVGEGEFWERFFDSN